MAKNPGIHLNNLHIEAFRGLRDMQLDDFGQFNLLVGPNNCGKTSVLEALTLYCMPDWEENWEMLIKNRIVGSDYPTRYDRIQQRPFPVFAHEILWRGPI